MIRIMGSNEGHLPRGYPRGYMAFLGVAQLGEYNFLSQSAEVL